MAIGTISTPSQWLQNTVVTPAFLQSVTDNINGFVAGTASMAGLVVDGTGGLSASTLAGTGKFSGSVINQTFVRGMLGKEMLPVAMGNVSLTSAGASLTASACYNLASASRTGTGQFQVNMTTAVPFSGNQFVLIQTTFGVGNNIIVVGGQVTSSTIIQIYTMNSTTTQIDPTGTYSIFLTAFSLV